VMCHLSHAYPSGASLYFTALAPQDPVDPAGQWERAKRAATDAIAGRQATITHHHAVGTDHAPWLAAEIGDLGVEVLRAVKARLDPAGILNPGKLIPAPTAIPAAPAQAAPTQASGAPTPATPEVGSRGADPHNSPRRL